jgi:sulfur carrier protein
VTVTVNGEPRRVSGDESVADIIGMDQNGDGRGLAVAVNGEVVARGEWRNRKLQDGDRVEILRAVGGG